ncbi:sodium-dependent transporter [Arthrobacter ginkgonis]|uniref:Transporter n=1 Tax=Arthrobacter ginkgonis TaxID=1630594 RepID=A0ABP7C2I6_9MICC
MTTPSDAGAAAAAAGQREVFSSRRLFILSAIGSAVGLGNIWRFPYIAYENGGGAFIIPYLAALLTAGIPLLFLDYALGHKFRGSAPLAYRRLHRMVEPVGWWQVLVCFVIAVYYAVIIAWAIMYTGFSVTTAWGDDASAFFTGQFLQVSETVGIGFDYVAAVVWPLLAVWVLTIVIMVAGVNKGIARANSIFFPLLMVMFVILVVQSLFLPGAIDGLNAFFTPDWAALANPGVWAAAYGHTFFSLSVAFGIMVTYSSYLKRKTDLTGSGLVVAFSNGGFEILAGIGVFAALGFMAFTAGTSVADVAVPGIGLAFIGFPTIASAAPFGTLIGILFFGSLVFAGMASLVSILEVIIAAVEDKLGWGRVPATLVVSIPTALVSLALFPTTTGLYLLDVSDAFVNIFGILAGALVLVILVAWVLRSLPSLSHHLNLVSSLKMRRTWILLIAVLVPILLGYIMINEFIAKITTPYEGYPLDFLAVFGWGMAALLPVLAILLTFIPWSARSKLHNPEYEQHQAAFEEEAGQ